MFIVVQLELNQEQKYEMLIPVAMQFKAWVCGCSLAGIVHSNPARVKDVCLL
jgi:hypothetical protein